MPVVKATRPAANQTMTQICSSEMPTDSPDSCLLKEQRHSRDHQRRNNRGGDVDFLQRDKTAGKLDVDGAARQSELPRDHDLGLAAEHQFAQADQEIGQAERRHKENDVGLIDQRSQHHPLDHNSEAKHYRDGHGKREICRNAMFV